MGIYKESPLLATYAPDSVNNYELGLKGRFANDFSYTFAVFDIDWDKPQISSTLPDGNLAVYNANTAQSKGFEFEARGPLFLPGTELFGRRRLRGCEAHQRFLSPGE